jgi:cation transport regulator ChaC
MTLVFQYGSNMSVARLNHADRLAGDAKVVGIATTIEPFELAFTVWSKTNACAAADIITGKAGRSIYGVVYDIPDFLLSRESARKHNRKSLDSIEGEGTNYVSKTIDLSKADGAKLTAITYVVKDPSAGLKTSLAYVQHIFDGLEEHNMPEDYRQYVVSRVIENNPELQMVATNPRTGRAIFSIGKSKQ